MGEALLLPGGQAWLGFDNHGICQSISIRAGDGGRDFVSNGGFDARLCKVIPGAKAFGRHISDFSEVSGLGDAG